ncbi:MAG: hypothetical protein ABXS92_08730 [Sulfurimonas sp.]
MLTGRAVSLLIFVLVALIHAEEAEKVYGVDSGRMICDIYGGGEIAPDVNLTINGENKVLFRNWGNEIVNKIDRTEIVRGSIQSVEKYKSLDKVVGSTHFGVDFDTQSITKSKISMKERVKADLRNMQRKGVMNIGSYRCDVWEKANRKICLYKGIVLLDEKKFLGFLYGKRVREIDLNATFTDEDFVLPDYPRKKEILIKDKIKVTQTSKSLTFSDKIINAKKEISPQDKNYIAKVNKFAALLFENEKKFLIQLLESLQETRACLYSADEQREANMCLYDLNEFTSPNEEDDGNTVDIWIDKTKQKILDSFDERIRQLRIKMPCINRSQNITDLSNCMK